MYLLSDRRSTANEVYSNFDHVLNQDVAEKLKQDPTLWSQHPGWNFCGWIRWDAETQEWVEEVWRFKVLVGTHTGEDLEEVIKQVNDEYGSA